MDRFWVVNSSPIIALSKLKLNWLLSKLPRRLVVPPGVFNEVRTWPEFDPARKWLEGEGARHIVDTAEVLPSVASWDLGRGESEVLSYGRTHEGFMAIIDDRIARNCAKSIGIPFLGTVGILVIAKQDRHIRTIREPLEELKEARFHLDDGLIQRALDLANE